ncbi:MAG: sigma 54-interacting transcriptional regulator [Holophaga sp.]|nr:sigma 54-interacting transcriptional regulator [Holophaga sp.]
MRMQNQDTEPGRPQRRREDGNGPSPGEVDARRLLQELELHKIELEMQNEELHRAQAELRVSRALIDQQVASHTAELTRAVRNLSAEVQERCQAERSLTGAFTELERIKDRLQAENASLHQQQDWHPFEVLIGPSAAVAVLRSQVEAAAALETPVLLLGEAGTGKGMAARAIHSLSARRYRPLNTAGCATLAPERLESMLFGEPRGGAPGARRRIGQFELADHGTLFLDEVGALPLELQARLLEAIRGQARPDVRILAGSNRRLRESARDGRFLEDLYTSLGPQAMMLPPLRERREDIPSFVATFMARFNRILGKSIERVSDRAMELLMARAWPGNLRELENVIELAMITCPGPILEFPERQPNNASAATVSPS